MIRKIVFASISFVLIVCITALSIKSILINRELENNILVYSPYKIDFSYVDENGSGMRVIAYKTLFSSVRAYVSTFEISNNGSFRCGVFNQINPDFVTWNKCTKLIGRTRADVLEILGEPFAISQEVNSDYKIYYLKKIYKIRSLQRNISNNLFVLNFTEDILISVGTVYVSAP